VGRVPCHTHRGTKPIPKLKLLFFQFFKLLKFRFYIIYLNIV